MQLIACTHDAHAQAILNILNHAIVTSTALYDYQPRSLTSMRIWFDAKAAGGFPVIGAVDEAGTLLGFASYGTWRAFPAYKYTVEHSVYVHKDHRGRADLVVMDGDLMQPIGGSECWDDRFFRVYFQASIPELGAPYGDVSACAPGLEMPLYPR